MYLILYISKETREDFDYCVTFPRCRCPHCLDSLALWFDFHGEAEKFKMFNPINISWEECGHSLVTMYDSCAGPLLPQQQARVKCVAHLIISNCFSACINLSYQRGFFFQQVFDIGTTDFPQPLTQSSFYQQDVSAPWNFKWRLCFLSVENTCILSNFVQRVVSWLFEGLGKSFERLWYPLAPWHLTKCE